MADDDALIAKAAQVLLPYLSYRDDDFPDEATRAVVAAVRGQIAAEAWERGAYAGREYQKRLYGYAHITSIAPGPPEMPRNPYRARVEALGATESAGEGENGGLGGREAERGCTGDSGEEA